MHLELDIVKVGRSKDVKEGLDVVKVDTYGKDNRENENSRFDGFWVPIYFVYNFIVIFMMCRISLSVGSNNNKVKYNLYKWRIV